MLSLLISGPFMMLSLLISGPAQPGNDIDVFLAPLIDDLKILWKVGVEAYDAYRKQHFTLRAVLLWTINDFPALGNLSGCITKGYYACPICSEGTDSQRLKRGRKNIYAGHRKFLPRYHPYRRQKKAFNGEQDFREAPKPLNGEEVLKKVEGIEILWGKKNKNKPSDIGTSWKKKSIFFELEYWKYLYIRHILDVMHIEKNLLESIIGTLLNIPGKTKDGVNSRLDLIEKGLREELAPVIGEKRTYLPPACYTLSREEKKIFCTTLLELKVPDGYSSNIRSKVSMPDLKLYGLKSHDCHVLMQQLLPLALRSVLPKEVRYAITRLCFFFNAICSKVVDVPKLEKLQSDLVITLCLFEKYFPPSFFDIMVHLTVHLVREVRLCGPVHFRWMYPFERYMKVLKGYVRNRNRPEGCIAESYIAEEGVEFCSDYLSGMDSIGVPVDRNTTFEDSAIGRPLPGGRVTAIDREEWEQAHCYVLENTNEVQPYIEEHMAFLKEHHPRQSKSQTWLQIEHNKKFIYWLREKVADELNSNKKHISNTLKWIAQGPRFDVIKYSGYIINGYRFHTKDRDNSRVTQNSGVSLVARAMQVTNNKDKNPVFGELNFYGVITEIWQLDYHTFNIPVFKCDWVDNNKGIKVDELGFTLVELGRIGHKSDCFILASQAKQVFYVEDQLDSRWSIVLEPPQRRYPFDGDDELDDCFAENNGAGEGLPQVEPFDVTDESTLSCLRGDCEGTWIDN
ncbi:uncharacterized protein LOC131317134 [Rhododendron vialii]|uniref:uncharacterized protein LOC131317134 n=1 Tax=Rhododendron vialii TaxID=182163 RepID=UPI00265D85B2|nr:uncharacterized protein LOC131317134 [Rhododendron vialii]